jgi:hypothetical protein
MEFDRIQPRDILTESNVTLKRKLRCSIFTIVFLGVALLASVLIN